MHLFKPSGLPRRLRLLIKLLANRLSQQAGKSLVIAMTRVSMNISMDGAGPEAGEDVIAFRHEKIAVVRRAHPRPGDE
jgi:hypothetical protein